MLFNSLPHSGSTKKTKQWSAHTRRRLEINSKQFFLLSSLSVDEWWNWQAFEKWGREAILIFCHRSYTFRPEFSIEAPHSRMWYKKQTFRAHFSWIFLPRCWTFTLYAHRRRWEPRSFELRVMEDSRNMKDGENSRALPDDNWRGSSSRSLNVNHLEFVIPLSFLACVDSSADAH